MRSDFCVFILSHGRAGRVYTLETLNRCGYTGKWWIVCDDEDKTLGDYKEIYGEENVLVFSKDDAAKMFDEMAVNPDRRVIVYARNICFKLAKEVGCRFFLELDDDYTSFQKRAIRDERLIGGEPKNIDNEFEAMVRFLEKTKCATVAFAQGGDLIGGKGNKRLEEGLLRKAMNTFFCDAERPFEFFGQINEDVNAYVYWGSRGLLFFTFVWMMITQKQTQGNGGGMTDIYLDTGTYMKTFFSVVCMPSAVKVSVMGQTGKRLHHKVSWNNCVPKIINEKWRKKR